MRDFTQVIERIKVLALESQEDIECFQHPMVQHAFSCIVRKLLQEWWLAPSPTFIS